MKVLWSLLVLGPVFVVQGCAGMGLTPMPLSAQAEGLDTGEKSTVLLTLRTHNASAPDYHPDVTSVAVRDLDPSEEQLAKKSEAALTEWFQLPADVMGSKDPYLLSFQLAPGQYEVANVRGISTALLLRGNFNFPIGVRFDVLPDEVVYIGSVEMTNRKRERGEPRSGSVIPLIDQAATGFGNGTFDVVLRDDFGADSALFLERFALLQGREIVHRAGAREAAPSDAADDEGPAAATP